VDHLIAVVERVEIAKGINLEVSSVRERLQGCGLAGALGAPM
jgi:hypothetical protein